MESVETSCARFTLRDDGILTMERLPDAEFTADLIPDQIAAVHRLIGEKRHPVLVDPRKRPTADPGVWALWLPETLKMASGCAVLHDEGRGGPLPPFARVLDTMLCLMKVFPAEAEAIEWLLGFVQPSD